MYIADLHIHSKYSRATSKELEPEPLDAWARRKGIGLVGTGDFTHPTWRAELRDKLAEAEEGLYTLKGAGPDAPRFVITGEISSIYKKNGKVFVRSGAGIVADSDPEKEFQECINKAKASLKALEVSQEVEE